MRKSGTSWAPLGLTAILLIWLGWLLAEPIGDADVFWHMAYAKQMIARHTLQPDHTLYSWMPSSTERIYCAWLSELLLLGFWNWLGIAGLAVLRYGAMLLTVALPAWFAWRAGILRQPLVWLLILLSALGGLTVSQPKPELFSLVLWHALLFCYFRFQLALRHDRSDASRWLYAVPALMLLWVNLHGGFILAAPFLALTLLAEWVPAEWVPAKWVPAWMRRGPAIPASLRWRMTICWCGALLATAATPYGVRYPLQLIRDYALGRPALPGTGWNSAYQSAFSDSGFALHLPEFLVWMTLAWIVLLAVRARRGPLDWLIPLLNLIYVPLYVVYVRSSFLLPVLFAYSVIWMVSQAPRPAATNAPRKGAAALQLASVALFLFWTGRSLWETRTHPDAYEWTGFGYSYWLPVEETDYLTGLESGPGPVRLYNLFDSGGYLLWRLYPRYQVMTDSRSFPYLSWFPELYHFTREASVGDFQDFLARHPANVALIDLKEQLVWRNFLKTPGWHPAFYGPTAAVFLKEGIPSAPRVAAGVRTLRSSDAAFNVFNYAVAVSDFRTAWAVLNQLNGPLRVSAEPSRLEADLQYREAHAALRAADYIRAERLFTAALRGKAVSDRDALILTLLRNLEAAADLRPPPDVSQLPEALRRLAAPE